MAQDVTILGRIIKSTGMAIYFRPAYLNPLETRAEWLPRSQVAVVQGMDGIEVTMPQWLAREKGWD